MAERAFAKIGYMNDQEQFVPQDIRARDVFDKNGISAEEHMGNAVIHLTSEQAQLIANAIQASAKGVPGGVATLGADGHLSPDQIDLTAYQAKVNAATYEAMLALDTTVKNGCPVNNYVFVTDATGDTTVTSGWAMYRRVSAGNTADDFVKVSEQESIDVVLPDFVAYENRMSANEQAAANAAAAASTADGKAVAAQNAADDAQDAADAAQSTADAAVSAASTADGKAVAAQSAADAAQSTADSAVSAAATADSKAVAAQSTADAAATEAAKLDFAFCTDEQDMATKNLRPGALVLMAVDND